MMNLKRVLLLHKMEVLWRVKYTALSIRITIKEKYLNDIVRGI